MYLFACRCGTAYYGNVGRRQLPIDFSDFSGSAAYKMAYGLPSLACQGKAVVRSVFKQNRMDWDRPGCTDFRLHPDGDSGAKSPEVVRCELALPSGGGSEVDRALRSKEVNCRICNLCRDGGWWARACAASLLECSTPWTQGWAAAW
jgi:hypothetical protein